MAYYYNLDFKEKVAGSGMSLNNTFVYDNRSGKYKNNVISGEEKINESIYSILSTRLGERLFLPEFGSKLHQILFEPNDLIRADLAKVYIKDALDKWEKRINLISVELEEVDYDTNTLPIVIYYRIANSNVTGSYVYPFNLGSNGDMNIHEFS